MSSARNWVVLASVITLGVSAAYLFLPIYIQRLMRTILGLRYSFRIQGLENLPKTGPTLLAANHLSWLDGFIMAAIVPRRGKAMVSADFLSQGWLRNLAMRSGMIPTPFSGPRAIRVAISEGRAALDRGECLGIFPEGQISRTGFNEPFYRGIELILQGRDNVPVIPMAIDNMWGSIFTNSGGRFLFKRPQGWRRTVNIVYGPPVASPVKIFALRQALMETLVHAYALRSHPSPPLETADPSLPRWEHPTLGLLTASAADLHLGAIHQIGQKEGSVGLSVPGVAIRVVDDAGHPVPQETSGRLQAFLAKQSDWQETGRSGSMDADGFVRLSENP